MARIVEHYPEPSMVEICSRCKEPIKLVAKRDWDGEVYPACANCGDCIENPYPNWKRHTHPDAIPQTTKSVRM